MMHAAYRSVRSPTDALLARAAFGLTMALTSALALVPMTMALAIASATAALSGERTPKADAAIVCVAGCRDTPPAVVGTASNVPAGPPLKSNLPDPNLVLRDVWCGEAGGCIALNHVAPPRLRDRDEHRVYISVWRPYW